MIYAVCNRKGGVGKTTTAWALAAGLERQGAPVLRVDLDAQRNLSVAMGVNSGATVYDVLTGAQKPTETIQKTAQGDIIPASKELSGADLLLTDTGKEYTLKEALNPVLWLYKHVVIDTPPALNVLTVNALTAADAVIIPAQADLFSLTGIEDLQETITPVKKYTNADLRIDGILLTRYNGRAVLSRDVYQLAQEAAQKLGTRVYNTAIREGIAIKEAQAARISLFDYAPAANVTKDYAALVDEITKGGR